MHLGYIGVARLNPGRSRQERIVRYTLHLGYIGLARLNPERSRQEQIERYTLHLGNIGVACLNPERCVKERIVRVYAALWPYQRRAQTQKGPDKSELYGST